MHDMLHALRELLMSAPVAKARFHLVDLAKNYIRQLKNQRNTKNQKNTDLLIKETNKLIDRLVDGELVVSYPNSQSRIFRAKPSAQIFGDRFYLPHIMQHLSEDLKKTMIKDMVEKKEFWKKEFNLGGKDLHEKERTMYATMFFLKTHL